MWTNSMVDSSNRKKSISGLNNAYNLLIRNSTENVSNTPSIEHDERQAIFELSNPKITGEPAAAGDGSGSEDNEAGSRNLHQLISPRSATRMRVLDRLVRGTTIFGLNNEEKPGEVSKRTSSSYLDIGQHELQKKLTSPNISYATSKQQKQIETEINSALVEEIKAPVKNEDTKLLQLSQSSSSSLVDFDTLEETSKTLKKIDTQFIRDHSSSADVLVITQLYANNSQSLLDFEVPSEFEFPPSRPRIVPLSKSHPAAGHFNHHDSSQSTSSAVSSSSSATLNEDSDEDTAESHFDSEEENENDHRGLLMGGSSISTSASAAYNNEENWNHEINSGSSSEDLSSHQSDLTDSQTSIDSTAPPAKKMKTRTSPEDQEVDDENEDFDLNNSSIFSLQSNYSAELLLPPCPIVTSSIAFNPEDQKTLPVRQHGPNGPIFHLDEALTQSLSLQSLQQIIPDPEDFESMEEEDPDDDDVGQILGTSEWDRQSRLRHEEKEKQRILWWKQAQLFLLAFFLPISLLILYQFLSWFWSTN